MAPQAVPLGSPLDAALLRAGWMIPTCTEAPPTEPDERDRLLPALATVGRKAWLNERQRRLSPRQSVSRRADFGDRQKADVA
jgi:hypothetical protein